LKAIQKIALEALITSIETFQVFDGSTKPHFAFGDLTKKEYEVVHALHIYTIILMNYRY
jgi:hypothetical protein